VGGYKIGGWPKRIITGLNGIFVPQKQKGVINGQETCGWLMVKVDSWFFMNNN
jgi:hypothetical protein